MDNKEILQKLVDLNYTIPKIAIETNLSESSVCRRLKKYGIRTNRSWNSHDSNLQEKTCIRCHKTKPIEKFPVAAIKNDKKYRRRYCNSCYVKSKVNRRIKICEWLLAYKKQLKCISCGNNDHRVLEFHHKDSETKEINISDAARCAWSIKRIMKEIEKCSVMCANCHRIHHYENK